MGQDPVKPAPGSPPAKQDPPAKDAPGKAVPGKDAPAKPTPPAPDKVQGGISDPARKDKPAQDATPPEKEPEVPPQPVLPLGPPPAAAPGVVAKPPPEGFQIGSILFPALWLVGILVIGALVIAWLKRTRDRSALTITTTASDQLETFREAYENGEMSREEFLKVKARLTEQLRDPLSMPPQAKLRQPGRDPESLGDETS
jgi:hypothetical protein